MFCICPASTDVYLNLATEEYLLKNSRENFFMLWQSDHAVVVGKHQNVEAEADLSFTRDKGIRIARRFSGGGAVYQDLGNINLTFIEKSDKIDFNKYMQRVLGFLSSIGIRAKADERLGITVNGLKISGSAQCVHKDRVLYHCTLLYATDLDRLNLSLNGKPALNILPGTNHIRAVSSVRSQVTNISREMHRPPALKDLKSLLLNYFLEENRYTNSLYHFTPEEIAAIEKLSNGKYVRAEWIFHRKSSLNLI